MSGRVGKAKRKPYSVEGGGSQASSASPSATDGQAHVRLTAVVSESAKRRRHCAGEGGSSSAAVASGSTTTRQSDIRSRLRSRNAAASQPHTQPGPAVLPKARRGRRRLGEASSSAPSVASHSVTDRQSNLRSRLRVRNTPGLCTDAAEVLYPYEDLGDCNHVCEFCGATFWFAERVKASPLSERLKVRT